MSCFLKRACPVISLFFEKSVITIVERVKHLPIRRVLRAFQTIMNRDFSSWIKKIVFNFPVPVDGEEVKELPLETETTVECIVLMSRKDKKEH